MLWKINNTLIVWALPKRVGLFASSFGSMRASPKAAAAIPNAPIRQGKTINY
tara:strand:- start:33 stop:188 length:156 start_codon:yes stop_codon:yes gene_type:complete